jgi:aminopeptidase N
MKGLNTYRLSLMLWDKAVNTQAQKFSIGNVIGHELTHQYWGNLVTHTWWNDWWLTEGFASYYEYVSFTATFPEFESINRVTTSDIQPAMAFDIGPDSVPIHGNNTEEFVENPSTINYSKGASLVRMMEGFLSEPVFKQACSFYLNNRKYTAVNQDALFNDINSYLASVNALPTNGFTMKEIMDTWTLQTGFPLVRVARTGPNTIYVSQESFEKAENRHQSSRAQKTWHVPIAYVSQSNPSFEGSNLQPKFWLEVADVVKSHRIDTQQWIVLNPDARCMGCIIHCYCKDITRTLLKYICL